MRSENIVNHNVWGSLFCTFGPKKARSGSNHNENFMPFSLFKMLKNRWDQVKIPASEIRFSKTFRFVAQVDAFLVIFHFWATIRLCFTTRIAWRFPEAESSLGVTEYHRFSIFENAKNFQGNRNYFGNFFRQIPRGPSTTFDFSAPGRPPAGQSLLPPTP